MSNRAARIILDAPDPVDRNWCWRGDWMTGWDSIYGLLAKFAKLNAIPAKELANLFISSTCGRKTAIVKASDVDLRVVGPFDIAKLSSAFGVSAKQVQTAFVGEVFPNSRRKALPYLKWCCECMREGFHSPIHQLEFISACPIHGSRLVSRCPRCQRSIPYRLTPEVFRLPYGCPHCEFDLAPLIREPQTRSLALSPSVVARLDDVYSLIVYEDEVLSLAFELDRQRWRDNRGRFLIESADLRRERRDYAGFASQVVEALRAETHGQIPLAFDQIEVIRRTSWTPPIARCRRKSHRRKASTAQARWDVTTESLYRLYGAIRRHLWRHAVMQHRRCCITASRGLWWNLEGEQTACFCPVAEAFIRWRMYWEGEVIPQHLFGGPGRLPSGIVAWRDESAPVLRFGWSPTGEAWLIGHVFALAVVGSFLDIAEVAFGRHSQGQILWNRRETSGRHGRYWAVTGNDTRSRPLILFQQLGGDQKWIRQCSEEEADRQHSRWHAARLQSIAR